MKSAAQAAPAGPLAPFAGMLPAVDPGQSRRAAGFWGAGVSLAAAAWRESHKRPVVLLEADALSAAHATEEISFFAPDIPARLLPDWGCLPFDVASPPPALHAERMAALSALLRGEGIVIAAASTALQACAPTEYVGARVFDLQVGGQLKPGPFVAALAAGGYARVDRVLTPGEFASYGGQIDVFPPDCESPFRLVLEGDCIEQIRIFDPRTQMSSGQTPEIKMLPAGECDLSEEGVARFRQNFMHYFGNMDDPRHESVRRGQPAPGMEFLLPLFHGKTARITDYAPSDALFVLPPGCPEILQSFYEGATRRRDEAAIYGERAALPTSEIYSPPAKFLSDVEKFASIRLSEPPESGQPPDVAITRRGGDSQAALKVFLADARSRGESALLAADSPARRDSLHAALSDAEGGAPRPIDGFAEGARGGACITVAPLRGGFRAAGLTVLTESEIFQVRLPPRRSRMRTAVLPEDLAVGDFVAHRDHGIGRYGGLEQSSVGGDLKEFLRIDYADGQMLLLPVAHFHLLSPYYGEQGLLSKMGRAAWKRARARAEKSARDAAARMLETQARRAAAGSISHRPNESELARFAAGFPHEETPDQEAAAKAVLEDMRSARPMDRLLAADVGFGKTEVAMRAACACVLSGHQTAVLAPTTLLAEQHARTFAERFAGFPVRIVSLTRLTPAHEKKEALAQLADGSANIAIGTHALLQTSAKFARLGLAVIDEEHRFGVRQKEHFKHMRAEVDVLSLSATPIPRTLSMALDGVRDISVISTPPLARLAVRTVAASFSGTLVRDACERELMRGGQIYFVHNDIASLPAMETELLDLLPAMRIVRAHGSMGAADVEEAMRRFLRHEADMLLATTIVESGLDVANANTIIINRADRMGVSRLHQLRGRVGRAGAQAFAYLLTPPEGAATEGGGKRLDAVSEHGSLGDGLRIAMRDLETRGAGEVFGERQSGDLAAVGAAMYEKMVKAAARQLEGGEDAADWEAVIDMPAPALLPENYVHAPLERLRYYRALSACRSTDDVDAVRLEWEDRFGSRVPEPALLLLECHKLRLHAGAAQAVKVRAERGGLALIEFAPSPRCAPALLRMIREGRCRARPDGAALLEGLSDDLRECARQIRGFLKDLASSSSTGGEAAPADRKTPVEP